MTLDTAPPAARVRAPRHVVAALLAVHLLVAATGGQHAAAADRPGGRLAATGRYVLPTGDESAATTRADLLAAGVLVRDFAPPSVRWGPGHRGVDLHSSGGAQVVAPRAGTVTFVGVVVDRPLVVVAHPDGLRSTLEPVSSELVAGTVVTQGEVVGTLASGATTHCAPDSCLHWGVRLDDEYIDPLSLVVAREPVVLLPLDGP